MDRKELLSLLRRVRPAVVVGAEVQAFASVFFSQGRLYAYNDELGIHVEMPEPSDEFGVDFRTLNVWLGSCSGSEVTWDSSDGVVTFRCARSRVKLPSLSLDQLIFPAQGRNMLSVPGTGEFIQLLEDCAKSMAADYDRPKYLGVTFVQNEEESFAYSTTNIVLSRAWSYSGGDKICTVIPPLFVETLLTRAESTEVETLEYGERWMSASLRNGDTLVTRCLATTDQEMYEGIFDDCAEQDGPRFALTEGLCEDLISLKKLSRMSDMAHASVVISGGTARVGLVGEAFDFASDRDVDTEGEVSCFLAPSKLPNGLAPGMGVKVTPSCIVFTGKTSMTAISCVNG